MNRIEHLLVCLCEECSEVQKEASKALRFGLDNRWKSDLNTAEKLAYECWDFLAVFQMLKEEGVIPDISSNDLVKNKKERVLKYMDYARDRGVLD